MTRRQRSVPRSARSILASAILVVVMAACGEEIATTPTTDLPATTAPNASATSAPTAAGSPAPGASAAASTSPTVPLIVGPATADERADRSIAAEVGATCDLDLVEALATRHPGVRQFVTVVADSWTATTARLEIAAFDGTSWICQMGTRDALVGRSGMRPLIERRSGDGTTPAGVFPLGTQTAWDGQQFQFFGNSPDPGVRGTYRDVQQQDCWGATPGASTYQQLYARTDCPGPDDEWLPRFGDVYSHAAVIGANLADVSGDGPGEPAYAAAIFLHRHNYAGGTSARPTSGCVSLAAAELVTALRLIDPGLEPYFAIGLRSWVLSTP